MNRWLRVKMIGDIITVGHVRLGRDDLFDDVPDQLPIVPRGTLSDVEQVCDRPSRRGRVTSFTTSSRRRLMTYLATCRCEYTTMITLTVPEGMAVSDGTLVKLRLDEMARFLLAKMTNANGPASVFWLLEFQENNSPHFHLLINGWVGKKMLSNAWAAMWTLTARSSSIRRMQERGEELMDLMESCSTRVEELKGDGAIAYFAKYGGKADQKAVPSEYLGVGRFWGIYGSRVLKRADMGFIPLYNRVTGDLAYEVQHFWISLNRALAETNNVVIYPWRMGTGVCIYRKNGAGGDGLRTLGKRLLSLCCE